MRRVTRRSFVKGSVAAGVGLGLSSARGAIAPSGRAISPNSAVRLAIVGLGGIDVPGSVGGRGRQLIDAFQKVPGAKIAALCDVDKAILEDGAERVRKAGGSPATYNDVRRVLDNKNIDAVAIATPNHWHVLASLWACQAGKDVYVEKPLSHNIWEGRQLVAAAKKYSRVVDMGTQARSSPGLRDAFEFIRSGQIGKIRYAHVVVYRLRQGIGKITEPTPVPPSVDYNLWCGPAPIEPVKRKQLHYDWHWFWSYGAGEIGNNGVHYIDMCRWALGNNKPPRRAMSIGGRFAYDDDGETPNTDIAFLDCEPAPIICELRGLPEKKGGKAAGTLRNLGVGIIIQCEGGYFTGSHPGGKVFDNQDKLIKDMTGPSPGDVVIMHVTNFIEAVRSGNAKQLNAPVLEGHLSAACSHMANISYRLGVASAPEAIREATRSNKELADAFERCREHLAANDVDVNVTRGILGPWVTLDPDSERFVGEFSEQANRLAMREYREPFVVPAVS